MVSIQLHFKTYEEAIVVLAKLRELKASPPTMGAAQSATSTQITKRGPNERV